MDVGGSGLRYDGSRGWTEGTKIRGRQLETRIRVKLLKGEREREIERGRKRLPTGYFSVDTSLERERESIAPSVKKKQDM